LTIFIQLVHTADRVHLLFSFAFNDLLFLCQIDKQIDHIELIA